MSSPQSVVICTIRLRMVLVNTIHITIILLMPIPLDARSKAWVFGRWLAEIVGSNSGRELTFRKHPTVTVTPNGFKVKLFWPEQRRFTHYLKTFSITGFSRMLGLVVLWTDIDVFEPYDASILKKVAETVLSETLVPLYKTRMPSHARRP